MDLIISAVSMATRQDKSVCLADPTVLSHLHAHRHPGRGDGLFDYKHTLHPRQ